MITVKNDGDLGNQMFQYSFLRCHAEKNSLSWEFYDHWVNNFKYNEAFKDIFKLFNLASKNIDATRPIETISIADTFQEIKPQDNIIYKGWFQSEKYFKNNKDNIKNWFTPRQEFLNDANSYIKKFTTNNCSIDEICAIHYRGTSYRRLGWDIPYEWYERAINEILSIKDIKKFIIFTDDVPHCTKLWGKKYEIINNNRLLDYSILFQFKNFIISPSSFSFWPAWLQGEIVIAPQFWFGHSEKTWKPTPDIRVEDKKWRYIL